MGDQQNRARPLRLHLMMFITSNPQTHHKYSATLGQQDMLAFGWSFHCSGIHHFTPLEADFAD